ncbi:insulin gene enhancer protein ISL-2B-like isoform X1 [Bolinopsis microptera]|uniref:insulin gene enhancer protein ISL-2B-like isoform X1 n=1 Tax=Bolinopsis microptera TaxID=2820187 RepID=UPI003079EAD8
MLRDDQFISPLPDKGVNPSVCAGCRCPITDQFILRVAPNLEWHASCLKCDDCNKFLDENCTCFIREGKPYCKKDFVRFGAKCHRCDQGFSSNDFVMRVRENIFHLSCFRCNMCSRQLVPGEEFALLPEGLICGTHIKQQHHQAPIPHEPLPESKPRSTNTGSSGEQKTTRVRTVLNDRQLRILRTCYNNNPRPDALMKEQMTKLTGLSARVIRVWFQNKRCKDKKKAIAAASGDDVISSSVADSPSEDRLKSGMDGLNEKDFSSLDCSQIDFNNSSTSTSPALSATGDTYSMYDATKDSRSLWNTGDFIPSYTQDDTVSGHLSSSFEDNK